MATKFHRRFVYDLQKIVVVALVDLEEGDLEYASIDNFLGTSQIKQIRGLLSNNDQVIRKMQVLNVNIL